MQREGNRVVESATEARAGETGHHVRYILAASTILCAILFAALYVYFFT